MALENQVWLITGVSSGMGRAIAEQALQAGATVLGTMRRQEQFAEFEALSERAVAIKMDITKQDEVSSGIEAVKSRFGHLDVLVNNAGYGLVGAVEETTEEEAHRVFETNFFGALRVTQAVLPLMREQKKGRIITISAIAGFSGLPGFGVYGASKFALEGLFESLSKEVKSLGIQVSIVTLGVFRTAFAGGALQFTEKPIADYAETAGRFRGHFSNLGGNQNNDPAKAAQVIVELSQLAEAPVRLFLGDDAVRWGGEKIQQLQADYEKWQAMGQGMQFEPSKP